MSKRSTHRSMLVLGGVLCAAVITAVIIAVGPFKRTDEPPRNHPETQPDTSVSESRPALGITTVESLRKEAMGVMTRLVKDFPKDVEALGLMGNMYVARGNTAEAIKCWEKCIELAPRRIDGYSCLIRLALDKGQCAQAEALARRALAVDPKAPIVYGQLGRALIGLGRPKEAVAALRQDVKISPRASVSHFYLAQAHQQLGQYDKAKDSYMTAMRIDPEYAEACYGIALASARLGQEEDAAKYREKFEEIKTRKWKSLPSVEDVTNRQEALETLRRAVAHTHTNAGMICFDNGHFAVAEKHWQRAALLDPNDTVCRSELLGLYGRDGRNDRAMEVCEQLCRINPKNPKYFAGLSMLLAKANRIDEAISAIEKARKLDPTNIGYWQIHQHLLNEQTK
ncbi:MAG: tetratricopeptide repeat protein [Phycisphaerae bacterium]|jgi:tetratricopeptide (TPR) repeat protein|nr:tetratricopeptide repeat protein [Phycisphaerae bacterium]